MASLIDKKNKAKEQNQNKIMTKFNSDTLRVILSYIVCDNQKIHRGHYINMKAVFDNIDREPYLGNSECEVLIDRINKALEARVIKGFNKSQTVIQYIGAGFDGNGTEVVVDPITDEEIKWVDEAISIILKTRDVSNAIPKLTQAIDKYNSCNILEREKYLANIEAILGSVNNEFRKHARQTESEIRFSLEKDEFTNAITMAWNQVRNIDNCLQFGCQGFNYLTGGGLQRGRVYMLLGLPGEGKSSTLLDWAIQLKTANVNNPSLKQRIAVGKKPCVVLLVMENSIFETVERLYSMCTGQELKNCDTPEEAIKALYSVINLETDPVDLIIKYKPGGSVTTDYLYKLYDDLWDENYQMIALLQDYIKRINSAAGNFNGDYRKELGEIVNEFKVFAVTKNIPFVSASQLNREATGKIDAARLKNKNDLVRMIGRSNVGESNLIIENSDWVGILAPEENDNIKYLGMARVKSRYYIDNKIFAAYIPYITNTIKFIEDINGEPTFKVTLKKENENSINAFTFTAGTKVSSNSINGISTGGLIGDIDDDLIEKNDMAFVAKYRSLLLDEEINVDDLIKVVPAMIIPACCC